MLYLLKNINILYVEDEIETKELMLDFFSGYTNNILIAKDGIEAFELYQNNHIDLIITDINMPKMNGIELIKKIRATDEETAILFFTAHNKVEYLLSAANLDIQGYLLKPICKKNFEDTFKKVFRYLKLHNIIQLDENLSYNLDNGIIYTDTENIVLNRKEKLLLNTLIKNKNKIISTIEIEHRVWMIDNQVMTNNALRTTIKNLRQKLPLDLIQNIPKQGYLINF